jgi:hypothetical protein
VTEDVGFVATGTAFCAAALRYLTVLRGRRSIEELEAATAMGFFAGIVVSLAGLYLLEG